MALWLVKGEIKFFRPSVGCLEIPADVEPERHDRVQEALRRRARRSWKRSRSTSATVRWMSPRRVMTYYARQSDKLRTDGTAPDKVNILYQHKLVSSAELIAGVRARESGGLFETPSRRGSPANTAWPWPRRFCEKIAATGRHGRRADPASGHADPGIRPHAADATSCCLGAGYDMRPFRLDLPARHARV